MNGAAQSWSLECLLQRPWSLVLLILRLVGIFIISLLIALIGVQNGNLQNLVGGIGATRSGPNFEFGNRIGKVKSGFFTILAVFTSRRTVLVLFHELSRASRAMHRVTVGLGWAG
jgi:hypothetical protein